MSAGVCASYLVFVASTLHRLFEDVWDLSSLYPVNASPQLVPMLEDNGLWICKILSIQLPLTVYNFFGVIYVIVALGGGTPFHPSTRRT